MASRINYNSSLKSVRTIRAVKIDPCEPPKISVDEPGRPSDADLINRSAIAFVWENAPGRSKIDPENASIVRVELKPPPHQARTAPLSNRGSYDDIDKSPSAGSYPAAAHMQPNSPLADNRVPPPPAGTPPPSTKSKSSANHQLPPKPSQPKVNPVPEHQQPSDDKPPSKPRTTAPGSVPESGHHRHNKSVIRNGGHSNQSGRRTRSQEFPVAKNGHHSFLASTLHALISDDSEAAVPHSDLNRGSADYLAERLKHSPVQGVKDFYLSGRNNSAGTVPSRAFSALPKSSMLVRLNSLSVSEASSHSDDGEQTDAGDAFSHTNMTSRDPDARCQVSVIDGEQLDLSRHTDPHARDFIMERFLPAAKAMVTETSDASDRRSSKESPSGSPTRGKGRPSLPGRSRFAFKDQFTEEMEQEEVDQSDMLYKCKFPWQMGALRSVGPLSNAPSNPRSVEQSPLLPVGNSQGSKSQEQNGEAWVYAESGSIGTPKGGSSGSFEARGLPPKPRDKNGSVTTPGIPSRIDDADFYESSRGVSFSGASMNGVYYEGYLCRSNEASARGFLGVPKDRLHETGTHGECDIRNRNHKDGDPGTAKKTPDMTFTGTLGTLLRTTQQQRRDLGKISEAAIEAAVANVQEPIPPSSIMNHHRCKPPLTATASAPESSTHSRSNSTLPASYVHSRRDSALSDEGMSYPKHLVVNLVRQRSLESLNDEVWVASGRNSSPGSKSPADPPGILLTDNPSNLSDSANGDIGTSGWPLGKAYIAYARTPSSDSKDASFSSASDQSLRSPIQQEKPISENYSPVSVLQPPLPKSPAESWLFKVRPPAPPSTGSHWQGATNPKKYLDYSLTDDSMDVKWEVLVKSENSQLRNKPVQEDQRKAPGLEKSEILGSKAR